MPGVWVIVAYHRSRKKAEVLALVRARVPILRKEGLVTDRTPVLMRARDRTSRTQKFQCPRDVEHIFCCL